MRKRGASRDRAGRPRPRLPPPDVAGDPPPRPPPLAALSRPRTSSIRRGTPSRRPTPPPAPAGRARGPAPAPATPGGAFSPKDLKYPPRHAIQAPNAATFTLPNGMKVWLMEDHDLERHTAPPRHS